MQNSVLHAKICAPALTYFYVRSASVLDIHAHYTALQMSSNSGDIRKKHNMYGIYKKHKR